MKPAITVLMPCYNAQRWLREAIESVLSQTYENFEYILVDDGSTDETLEVINEYASKDRRLNVIAKRNTGLVDSLNVGIKQAKGEWIARLDADDISMPDRLAKQFDFTNRNPQVVLVGGGCIEIDEGGNFLKQHSYPVKHERLLNRLERLKAFFPHSSAFFKKDHVLKIGGYNTRFIRSQDWDLWLRIAETAPIGCLPDPVIKLRKHASMISNTNNGKLQQVNGLAVTICHFRRKFRMPDPSQMSEDIWQRFMSWLESHLEKEGYFLIVNRWLSVRKLWYSDTETPFFIKATALLKKMAMDSYIRKGLLLHFKGDDTALRLAKLSPHDF